MALQGDGALDGRHAMQQQQRDDRMEDGVQHEQMHIGDVGAEAREHRAGSEARVAADGKRAERLALVRAREAVHHARSLRMIERRAEAAGHRAEKQHPEVRHERQHGDARAADDDAERREPRPRDTVGIIAEHRLQDGRKHEVRENQRPRVLIIQRTHRDEIRQQRRQRPPCAQSIAKWPIVNR